MSSYTRQMADFAASLRFSDIPGAVVAWAKQLILDGLGCALFASDVAATRILADVIKRMEPHGGTATIWGRGESASAVNAALVNGTMIQGYELDDGFPAGSFHGSAAVLPAAFAAAEYAGADVVSGEQLLRAIIGGFEIGPRINLCMNGDRMIKAGWHAPATSAPFPAAIASGMLLGLGSDQLFHALGMAGTQAAGLMAAQYGSMFKRMQCAKGSQSGLYSALLAAGGCTGIEDVFEQEFGGYCSTFSQSADQFQLPLLVDGLGTRWETLRISIKMYACLGINQAMVCGIEELMKEDGLAAAQVEAITIGVTAAQVDHSGWWPYVPNGLTAAQMHGGFCVAMQLIEGEVFTDQMVEENVGRPDLVALANRVRVVRSVEREQRGELYRKGCDIEVRLKSGAVLKKILDFRPGHPRRPLTREQVRTKFRRLAGTALPPEKMDALETAVWGLEQARTITPLLGILRGN